MSLLGALIFGVLYTLFAPSGDVLQGTVTRVVDGDTIHVRVAGEIRRVRLIGVDTPETVHPRRPAEFYGQEASDFARNTLLNRTVWLEYDVAPKDRYDRHLAYVWLARPETGEDAIRRNMFNARLLLGGYGRVMTIQPNSRYSSLFARFQQEARSERRGLWAQ